MSKLEFKGTKGEWKIVRKGNTVQQLCIQVDKDNKVCGNISPKRMNDAKLIAAAPDLLEALQGFIHDYETKVNVFDFDMNKAREAIKKALD